MMISTTMDNTALIQWQPPKDMVGELMGYQLQYKRADEDQYTSLELRKTNDHYTATGVHKGATYIFRLSARNRAGVGEAYVKEISTPEDVPSGFPINLRVTGLTQSSTQLAWEPPLLVERNGKITSYVVVYRDINIQQNNTNRTSDTQLTIQGLSPDTTYDIRVQAFTSKGGGPLSPSIQSRTMSNGRTRRFDLGVDALFTLQQSFFTGGVSGPTFFSFFNEDGTQIYSTKIKTRAHFLSCVVDTFLKLLN